VRITDECYAPLADLGAFEWLSFDIGPTLARWLERERPDVHEAIVAGDRASRDRLGHGNAIAQPFHHIILPLASEREKATEIRWGLQDFERRFERPADGMWLPETAVDRATLTALADAGIAFTVLAPHQVSQVPPAGVGRITLDRGRSIAVFVYDGDLSHGVAFGELLEGHDAWFDRIALAQASGTPLISLAMDGETFGHHHPGADRTLVRVIERLRLSKYLRIENFSSVLAKMAQLPEMDLVELELVEPTSWSCPHGVERWRAECGCKMIPERPSQQRWRAPLREALDELASGLLQAYRTLAPIHLEDPDGAKGGLGRALGAGRTDFETYATSVASGAVGPAAALLEMARDSTAMFTSCGWFFDEVAGLEAGQILQVAAHAIDQLSSLDWARAAELEDKLIAALSEAPSNDDDIVHAGRFYAEEIRGAHPFPTGGEAL